MTPAADDLLALALKCEAAAGADRELDAAIFLAANPRIYTYCGKVKRCAACDVGCRPKRLKLVWPEMNGGRPVFWYETVGGSSGGTRDMPFTASLDAAMTLVPEGWWFRMTAGNGATVHAWLMGQRVASDAATPALALCAASLRARAAAEAGQVGDRK